MASAYRLKAAALENLKAARAALREQLGSAQVGEKLSSLTPAEAGQLANTLLEVLDAMDAVTSRAKPLD